MESLSEGADFDVAGTVEIDGDILDVESIDVSDVPDPFGGDLVEKISLQKSDRGTKAKSTPPTADEWQVFFAKFVIRGLTAGYLHLALGDIQEQLSDEDKRKIKLTSDELMEISAPIAGFASKNSFLKKHGRTIVSSAQSMDTVIGLYFWMRRVNKIGKKYRANQPQTHPGVQETILVQPVRSETHVATGPNVGEWIPGPGDGYVPGFGHFTGGGG